MNRQKTNGGWEFLVWPDEDKAGFTWNPASGCNKEGCAVGQKGVCWAEKIVKRGGSCELCPTFKPHMHPWKLDEPKRRYKSANITPVSTGDLFGLRTKQTKMILDVVEDSDQHDFMILTKLPQNAWTFGRFPENVWFGTSINRQEDIWRLRSLEKSIKAEKKWAIFEPLYSEIDYDLSFLDWVIVGAQTRPERQPSKPWVGGIVKQADENEIPVWIKSNLKVWPNRRKEHP